MPFFLLTLEKNQILKMKKAQYSSFTDKKIISAGLTENI